MLTQAIIGRDGNGPDLDRILLDPYLDPFSQAGSISAPDPTGSEK